MISLGLLIDVPLDMARKRAADARDLLCQGIDPSAHRQAEKTARKLTFESVGRQWLADRENLLRKGVVTPTTFRKQRQILEQYLFPTLGLRPIRLITSAELLLCVKAIEAKGLQETAHRARRACWRICNLAEIQGQVDHNAADALRGALEALRPIHHAGITDPRRLGELLRSLRGFTGNRHVWYGLQLLPLLFVRPSELRLAEWSEFDFENAVWRIPPRRMKNAPATSRAALLSSPRPFRHAAAVPDDLGGLIEQLPSLRTGEGVFLGECMPIPSRIRVRKAGRKPVGDDPKLPDVWQISPRPDGTL